MFAALFHGPGQGCDHYVGCNQLFVILPPEITSMEAAEKWMSAKTSEDAGLQPGMLAYHSLATIARCTIFEITNQHMVNLQLYKERPAQPTSDPERTEYERLKQKFG